MWTFADPLALLLLPLPLAMRFLRLGDGGGGAVLTVPRGIAERLEHAAASPASALRGLLLPALVWLGLVLALAGPKQLLPELAAPTSGREIVLALDLSGSMVERDFSIDGHTVRRIDAVKHAATQFVRGRGGDRVSLILFGSKAYFGTPQTYDVEAVAQAIDSAEIGISGRATGIGDAMGLALRRLRGSDATAKVVVLLSDGVNNSGPVRPRDAARLAAEHGVRFHTIAMGPNELGDDSGSRDVVDVATLDTIARISGGESFRVRTTDDLMAVADEIDRLESRERDGPAAELYRDLWIWPALAALAGLIALLLLHLREAN